MNFARIPTALKTAKICKVLLDGPEDCVIHKSSASSLLDRHGCLGMHAISVILNGTQRIHHLEENWTQEVHSNQWIFLPKGLYQISDLLSNDAPFEAVIFYISDQLTETFLAQIDLPETPIDSTQSASYRLPEQAIHMVRGMLTTYGTGSYSPDLSSLKILELLHLLRMQDEEVLSRCILHANGNKRKPLKPFMEQPC